MPTEIDSLQISINAQATKANRSINTLIARLDVLSSSLGKLQRSSTNLVGLANGVEKLGRAMQTMNTVKTADFTRLANNLAKIGTVNVSSLNSTASSLSHLTRAFNNLGTVSKNAVQVGEMAKNLARLGYKSVDKAIANLPLLADGIKRLMATLSTAPKVSENIIRMTQAIANLAAQGSKVGTASRSMSTNLGLVTTSTNRASFGFKGLTSAIGMFYARYFLVLRGIKLLYKAIDSTADYIEAYNYFNVALGKIGADWKHQFEQYGYEDAEAYAESFTTRLQQSLGRLSGIQIVTTEDGKGLLTETGMSNLGMNIKEITQYASQLASVTNSVGQTAETSLAIAGSFTKLAGDISSLFNIDYSSVAKNFQSGLIGQSRALYKYGIDITNATLQTYAYGLGLEKAVSEMTQAEKMQLRVLAILDQSKVAWGDLANTINSPSNMIRQFKNNAKELGMVFGQLLIPMLQKIMPFLNGVTIAIKNLLVTIASLLGIKLNLSEYGAGFSQLEEDIDGVADGFDTATAAADKFKSHTLGIDELNILPSQNEQGGGAGGVGGGSIDLTDEILEATQEYESKWKDAFDKMENRAQEFAGKIKKFLEPITEPFTRFLSNLSMGGWTQAGMYAGETVSAIFDKVSDVLEEVDWDEIGNSIGLFLKGIEWTKIFSSVGNFIETAINAAIDLWKGAFKADPIATTIVTALAVAKFTGLGAVLASKIAAALPTGLTIAITAIIGFELGKGLGMLLNPEDSEWYNNFKFFGEDGFFKTITKDIEATLQAWSALTNDWENNPIIASLGTFFVGGLKKVDPPPAETIRQALEEGKIAALEKFAEIGEVIGTWFTEDVQPWFSSEKWQELFENAKIGLQTKWDEIVEWWQTTAIGKWFEEDVMPWFGKEKWDEVLSSIPSSFKQAFFNGVTSAISFINKLIDGIESMINSAIDGFAKLVEALNPFSEFMDSKGISFSVGHIDLPNIAIPQYQMGGFPEDGLFFANHNELVGGFNGRTAVANNEMIVEGIEGGVERAVAKILAPYLSDIARNTRETADKDMSVNIGDREIAKANARGSRALGYALIT